MTYVLLLDDYVDERSRTIQALQQALPDVVVRVAESTQDFARLIRASTDLVITDKQLAWADGLSILEAVKLQSPDCPVIMWSANATVESAVAAMKAGFDDYIEKSPSNHPRLVAAVLTALQNSQNRRQRFTHNSDHDNALLREQAARQVAEIAQQRLTFLADASIMLSSSLDFDTTLAQIVQLALGRIADWCSIYIQDANGTGHWVAFRATDPAKQAILADLHTYYPPEQLKTTMVYRVLATGQSAYIADLTDAMIVSVAVDARHMGLYRALNMQSYMVVPLQSHGQRHGVLVASTIRDQGRRYTTDDLLLAEELARRASLALENAQLYAEAQAAISARDQFLSIASHELRTPLTALMGYVTMLQHRLGNSDALAALDQRALRVMDSQTKRLNDLIGVLLDLSRHQQGQLSIQPTLFDLRTLARQVVEEIEPTLTRHTISLTLPDEPIVIDGDILRLEQVVQNLVQNAIKYSPRGGSVEVTVALQPPMVYLSVRDNGIGVPQAALSQLFRRFYRADNVDAKISGMGLGLFVVREIMALHAGTVEVESTEGQGSRFILGFPLPHSQPHPQAAGD